jgi:hypothetical protein
MFQPWRCNHQPTAALSLTSQCGFSFQRAQRRTRRYDLQTTLQKISQHPQTICAFIPIPAHKKYPQLCISCKSRYKVLTRIGVLPTTITTESTHNGNQ